MQFIFPRTPATVFLEWLDATSMLVRASLLGDLIELANHGTGGVLHADGHKSRRQALAYWFRQLRQTDSHGELAKVLCACAFVDEIMAERGHLHVWLEEIAACRAAGNLQSARHLGAFAKAWVAAELSWSAYRARSLAPRRLLRLERKQRMVFPVGRPQARA